MLMNAVHEIILLFAALTEHFSDTCTLGIEVGDLKGLLRIGLDRQTGWESL